MYITIAERLGNEKYEERISEEMKGTVKGLNS